ncbi:alanine racemase [Lacisediminihabitans changchengi]|uniref:Alanine racemase n=1 Tax=Lacisediminihabitans changchengi TaxID=2787634 RepID=A0A934SSF3_9MICO|nr:alanine racemase [Lacisediminihabitans changchengi]MBK4346719.1 alanine racemase [Lacisediminihabitans changchengi]MBK4348158.1 alanine racemase [Lacisediminihabitans changchengi]
MNDELGISQVMPPRITVDLSAYAQNLDAIRTRVAPAEVMAVLKSDGYGHGLLPIAHAALDAGITALGALDIDTSLRLRDSGIGEEVLIFAWLLAPDDDLTAAVAAGIDLGVSSLDELNRIAAAASARSDGRRARVHLKIDTGLHRNGVSPEHWPAVVERAVLVRESVDLVGIWTHIAEASDEEDTDAISRFHAAVAVAQAVGAEPQLRHLAASAASYFRADSRLDLVRVGAFGYGISPGGGITPGELGLTPVMTLTATVYASDDGTARLAIGSGDGISSAAAGRVSVAVNGRRFPVADVGLDWIGLADPNGELQRGDEAVLFGPGTRGEATLQEWADATGTIGEEIVTRLSADIPRSYPKG